MSDNSTNKLEGKINVTDYQKQEKISFEKQLLNGSQVKGVSSSGRRQNQLSPDKMVKVVQGNYMPVGRNFLGDDEEPQDYMPRDSEAQDEGSMVQGADAAKDEDSKAIDESEEFDESKEEEEGADDG